MNASEATGQLTGNPWPRLRLTEAEAKMAAIPYGTRVRFRKGDLSGIGTLQQVWQCLDELCFDVRVDGLAKPVSVFPFMSDELEAAH